MAEGIDGETADIGLIDLEHRHISELHELAAAAGVPRFRTLRRAELATAINEALQAEAPPAPSTESTVSAGEVSTTVGESVFAIIRLERGSRWTPAPKPEQVSVEKIVSSEEEADRETERLNALVQSEQGGASYFWRPASLRPGE